MENVVLNYEQAVLRSEKNLVDLSTLGFVRRHARELQGIMKVKPAKVIGKSHDGSPLFEQTNDPRVLHMLDKGKPVQIEIADPHLASAFRAINREKLPHFLRGITAFTRFYSGLATRFNPEFAASNKLRDLQEVMVYAAADKTLGGKGAAKLTARDPASMKHVTDWMMGRDTPGARLYQEMKDVGGTTGGMGLSTREQVRLNLSEGFWSLEKLATSKPRKFASKLVEYVDNWNGVFEDSTRLSVYKTAREKGLSKERAAFLAKEASINFNRMGTGGSVINGLWMFANASIQGSVKMMRAMKNPKVAMGVSVAVGSAVAAVQKWNDQVDPEWRTKVTKWDRLNSLTVVLPNPTGEGTSYVALPVSWGIKPIHVMASGLNDILTGHDRDLGDLLSEAGVAALDAYNPVGGTSLVQAVTPSFADVIVDIGSNKKWSGSRLRPDFNSDLPRDLQYFKSQKDTATGRAMIKATEGLRNTTGILLSPADLKYAIDSYGSGPYRFSRKTIDLLMGAASGNTPPADEFPFLSRFYRERTNEEIGRFNPKEMDKLRTLRSDQARQRFGVSDRADNIYRQIKKLEPVEQRAAFDKVVRKDRAVGAKVAKLFESDNVGLTYLERSVKKLGVKNGERARYIVDRFAEMNIEERKAFESDWRHKKIITPSISQQIRRLSSGKPLRSPRTLVRVPGVLRKN